MMFATLDDLEGQIEILVFNSAYADNAEKLDVDSVVILRGRVDHKEGGETKLVVQDAEPFEPSPDEVEQAGAKAAARASSPERLRLQLASGVPAAFLDDLKDLVSHFPGRHELVLEVGERMLVLGPDYRVANSSAFRADVASLAGGELSVV
jgi:DNA polymerase-3 subunit alpha